MLYIEEKTFDRQIAVLRLLTDSDRDYMCAWLYPESNRKTLAGYKVVPAGEPTPVTTYEDGSLPSRTELVPATDLALAALFNHKTEIKKYCDSIALYLSRDTSFYVAAIGHEGMVICHQKSKLEALKSAGFNASTEPPQWW